NPIYPAAVVAGNVETSQAVTDCIFGALQLQAGAQGTMNNFTFGDSQHQYYETIAGGSGAGNDFNGCDAVQTHMTNSRLTDPEIIEQNFPVIIEQFAIRENSGGLGQYNGGNGLIRRFRFLQPMTVSLLTNNRKNQPFGIYGGAPGQSGQNLLIEDDEIKVLPASCQLEVSANQSVEIRTPGGGGYGKPT
ncbi:MAG: hydantoinase B/oxoprolinase family protein, partial [Kangiellaceae bacterium]|nr:hydantoinase B/oxoprolinase family protein [Kangiellaceae bacterium]